MWFAGVGGTLADKYTAAYVFYALGGLWLFGWWIAEHPAPKKRMGQTQWKASQLKKIRKRRTGALVSLGVSLAFCWWTVHLQQEHRLNLSEDDLFPASEHDPPYPSRCNPSANDFKIFLGKSMAYFTGQPPYTFVTINNEPKLVIEKSRAGLAITTDVLAEDGRTILVRIVKNHFITTTGGEVLQRQRPDRSTLIVLDKYGNTALNVRYLNDKTIKIMGTFHYPSVTVTITEDQAAFVGRAKFFSHGDCFENSGIQFGPNGDLLVR